VVYIERPAELPLHVIRKLMRFKPVRVSGRGETLIEEKEAHLAAEYMNGS